MLDCSSCGQLKHKQQLQLPGVFLPTEVQFDREGQLWVVGGPLSGSHTAVCIGAAQPAGVDHEVCVYTQFCSLALSPCVSQELSMNLPLLVLQSCAC